MGFGIAEVIRVEARRKNIQLRSIADALGITPTALTRKLQKPRTIKLNELLILADVLGWSEKKLSIILENERKQMKGVRA